MLGYYLFGGIQRDVVLRVVDPFYIERVFYSTGRVQPEAQIEAQITVENGGSDEANGSLLLDLLAPDGTEAGSTQIQVKLPPGSTRDFRLSLAPRRGLRLWDVDRPNRYVAMAELRRRSSVADRQRTWIGISAIQWDAQTGEFQLNGRALKLRGMNRHQTFAYLGGDAPNRLQRRDARILKYQLGLNLVRSSHYPPDPEFLDECDRIGLLVMDEFPSWQFIGKSQK